LVGDGLAFELVAMFEFDLMFEFEVLDVVVAVFETVVVLPLVVEAVFDTDIVEAEFDVVLFDRFMLLVLFAVSPPQAAPNAAKPKSAESAIALFILKTISCLLQRLILDFPPEGRLAPKLFLFWNKRNDIEMRGISQPENAKKWKFLWPCQMPYFEPNQAVPAVLC
jgi:hypothetical protein